MEHAQSDDMACFRKSLFYYSYRFGLGLISFISYKLSECMKHVPSLFQYKRVTIATVFVQAR